MNSISLPPQMTFGLAGLNPGSNALVQTTRAGHMDYAREGQVELGVGLIEGFHGFLDGWVNRVIKGC